MLRSRTKKLVSAEDELSSARRPSPPSNPLALFERSTRPKSPKSPGLSALLGNSWLAIQDIAATVLADPGDSSTTRKRNTFRGRRTSASAPPPKQWGPAGADPHEEREAQIRALKRRDLLVAEDSLVADSAGRIKRRSSDEQLSASALPGDSDDRDALVYIHHVRPQDTLAGLSIKYNCPQAVIRKSNRMWPNDSVQTKHTILLPVDACAVKGRPVPGPDALPDEDLLVGDYESGLHRSSSSSSNRKSAHTINTAGLPDGWTIPKQKDVDFDSAPSSGTDTEPPYKHDSWVLLPTDKRPTQIGRMSRRSLGFFPPARRKSLAYSDTPTPRASVDLPRSSTSTNPLTSSPSQFARPRAASNLSSVSTHSHQRSTSSKTWGLHGPGGVGTLGRNVRSPGPAQDGLNKNFAQYLPSVAPPPGQEYFTPWVPSLLDATAVGTSSPRAGASGAVTPLASTADINFQEIGGAIEGWVRKVGTTAQKLLQEPGAPGQGKRSAVPILGAVGGNLGDLIELRDDAFDIGDGENGDDAQGRSRDSEGQISMGGPDERRSEGYSSNRSEATLVLRDRGKGKANQRSEGGE